VKAVAWALAIPAAVVSLIALERDSIDWPWCLEWGLLAPGGLVLLWDIDRVLDLLGGDDGSPGDFGDGGNGGGGNGG
jgi:hypothetical protein